MRFPPVRSRAPRLDGLLHIDIQRLDAIGCRESAQLSAFVQWITDPERFHLLDEHFFEFGSDALRHNESLGRDAGLAIVLDARLDCGCGGFLQVGAGHDNERIAPAEFQHNLLDSFRGSNTHLYSRTFTTRERCRSDTRIGQNAFHFVGTDQQRLKCARGEAALRKMLLNHQRALRHVRGVFQQTHVARHKRRGGKSEHLPERKFHGMTASTGPTGW